MSNKDPGTLYQLQEAKQFLIEHDRFLVVSHVQPDGDAASSTMAMGLILQALGKQYELINQDQIPRKFDYMSGYDRIGRAGSAEQEPAEAEKYACVITVDCADYARVGDCSKWFSEDAQLLNIDHHPTNDGFGTVRLIRPNAAATVQILAELIDELPIAWNRELADCIYTGLLTDTGGFRYSSTTPDVMKVASKMLTYGVEGHKLAEHLLEKVTLAHILILKKALASLSFDADNRISWMLIRGSDVAESGANNEDMEGIVNYAINVEGVEVGILFKEVGPAEVKVSLRSRGNVNVSSFAKSLGGGGHIRAAGCTIQQPLDDAVSMIITLLKRQFS